MFCKKNVYNECKVMRNHYFCKEISRTCINDVMQSEFNI